MADLEAAAEAAIIFEEDLKKLEDLVKKARKIMDRDADSMQLVQDYIGNDTSKMRDPYKPRGATEEYKLLIERSKTPLLGLVVNAPAQTMFVEGYRAGDQDSTTERLWDHWQRNRLDAAQARVYRGALAFGTAYVGVEKGKPRGKRAPKGPRVFTLSPQRTVALWFDPANDEAPACVVTFDTLPDSTQKIMGRGRMWTDFNSHTFEINDRDAVKITATESHGMSICPITAFDCFRDLEGNCHGIVEKLIPLQDSVNQSKFDLLVAQTYGSFKVRTAAGLTPPPMRKPVPVTVGEARATMEPDDPRQDLEDEAVFGYRMELILDESGQPIPQPITADATRFLVAADAEVKFGQLDETPLNGYIESISMSFNHVAAISQIPPHHLLGNLANLSADALAVAESSLFRMVAELQHGFGESWEKVMGLIAEADGLSGTDLPQAEVMWRDMGARSIGSVTDALGKMVQMLGVPKEGAWARVPGVTAAELEKWKAQKEVEEREQLEFQKAAIKAGAITQNATGASGQPRNPSQGGQPKQVQTPKKAAA